MLDLTRQRALVVIGDSEVSGLNDEWLAYIATLPASEREAENQRRANRIRDLLSQSGGAQRRVIINGYYSQLRTPSCT